MTQVDVDRTFSIEPEDDGFHWWVQAGSFTVTGVGATRSDAQAAALDAVERLAELAQRGRCLVCLAHPRRRGSATCSDSCAVRWRRFMRRTFARVPQA